MAVWAVDIGSFSLKAMHLSDSLGAIEVLGFEYIPHGKTLSGGGISQNEREELIALSLREFVSKNYIGKDEVIVSVSGHNSFARFVKLPPVEAKKIPEIVKFEASQQIPFDINEVQWDWQLMSQEDSAELTVGLFAIKNDIVTAELEHFSRENIRVGSVQMVPMALYNYFLYDRPDLVRNKNQATVLVNIGAENTDLVICTASSVWQRGIAMGGNAFTRAIADTFKLNFEKAEKLKRTAAMSKYARQIFQAMRPVFTDLASEIQRSLGFYTNSNSEVKLSRIIALGGGTKMRGLLKYLQQSLQIPVERPDSFKKLVINPELSAAEFHENVSDFAVVYGLGVQALGQGKIESNLLPKSIARSMAWAGKSKYFTLAALVFLVVSALALGRTIIDKANYAKKERQRQKISRIIKAANQAESRLREQKNRGPEYESQIEKQFELFKNRDIIPQVYQTLLSLLPNEKNNSAQKELYDAFANNDVEKVLSIPRKERKQIFITNMSIRYTKNLAVAGFIQSDFMMEHRLGSGGVSELTEEDIRALEDEAGYGIEERAALEDEVKSSGFVVTIAGYSPYGNIGELMDPAGVGDDKGKWGIVTKLRNLAALIEDGNGVFELYKKTEDRHFKMEINEVDMGLQVPLGVGVKERRINKQSGREELVLVDPMTKEVISKTAVLDENGKPKLDRTGNALYEVNDHWFVLNFKLVWKDAPKEES